MLCKFYRCEKEGERPTCCCKVCGNVLYALDPIMCYAECISGPGIVQKAKNFTKAIVSHVLAGMPKASDEVIEQRFSICKACQWFKADIDDPEQGICKQVHCGCSIKSVGRTGLNKLALANEACPIGKWKACANIDANNSGTANNIPF